MMASVGFNMTGVVTLRAVATIWERCQSLERGGLSPQEQAKALTAIQRNLRSLGITPQNSPLPEHLREDMKRLRTGEATDVKLASLVELERLSGRLATIPGIGVILTESGDNTFVAQCVIGGAPETSAHPAVAAAVWSAEHVHDPRSRGRIATVYARRLEELTHQFMEKGSSTEEALRRASLILGDELIGVAMEWQKAACIDALTSVMARTIGMRLVREAIVVEQPLQQGQKERQRQQDHVLIMVDIDHFKKLNDQQGHLFGDRVLREVGDTLRRAVGRPDDIVVRYGGEEFLILLRHTDMAGADSVIRRIQEMIRELEFVVKGESIRITASFGYAPLHNGVVSPDEVESRLRETIERADKALYAAKEGTTAGGKGRNQAVAWSEALGETPPQKP